MDFERTKDKAYLTVGERASCVEVDRSKKRHFLRRIRVGGRKLPSEVQQARRVSVSFSGC